MSTARSTGRATSSRPTSSAPSRCCRPRSSYWRALHEPARDGFRFHHISTDEVFGSLGDGRPVHARRRPTSRTRPIRPPRRRPTIWCAPGTTPTACRWSLTNCSNNYGPYHFPEKLIPLMIINALEGKPLPVYGKGANVRDWLYVEDHARALLPRSLRRAGSGETYNVGGNDEKTNLRGRRDDLRADGRAGAGRAASAPREQLITFVADRPGHDLRYAIDASQDRGASSAGRRSETFESGLAQDGRLVSRQPRLVGAHPLAASIAASGWGWWRDPAVRGGRPARPGAAGLAAARGVAARRAVARARPTSPIAAAVARRHRAQRSRRSWSTRPPTPRSTWPRASREAARAGNEIGPRDPRARRCAAAAFRSSTSRPTTSSTARRRAPTSRPIPIAPLGVYGRTKAAGEEAVRAATPRHRDPAHLLGLWRASARNFLKTMLRLAARARRAALRRRPARLPDLDAPISPKRSCHIAPRLRRRREAGLGHLSLRRHRRDDLARLRASRIVAAQAPFTGRRPRVRRDRDRRLSDAGAPPGKFGARLRPVRARPSAFAARPWQRAVAEHGRARSSRDPEGRSMSRKGIILAGGSGHAAAPADPRRPRSSCCRSTTSR